jgi:hypothetical protein
MLLAERPASGLRIARASCPLLVFSAVSSKIAGEKIQVLRDACFM